MTSRFVSCGSNDSQLNVYFYNRSMRQFTLNQTIEGEGGSCSILDFAIWENRIGVGRNNGDVYLYEASSNFSFSKKYSLTGAHSKSVRFINLVDDASILITAGA